MTRRMTDRVPASSKQLDSRNDRSPWYVGTHGERIAYESPVSGAYAIVESIAAAGCATPMHLNRSEEEQFCDYRR
jgi:hypothetical protein